MRAVKLCSNKMQVVLDSGHKTSDESKAQLCHLRFKHRLTPAPVVFHLTLICIYLFSFNLVLLHQIFKCHQLQEGLCPLTL